MTDSKHTGGALACLVDLTNPPPRPDTAYGEWKGGWVDFDGTNLQVGSARGDPGPFLNGNGPELANGDSLSFGDYRCRADQAGLFCVNYAHQSAVRFSRRRHRAVRLPAVGAAARRRRDRVQLLKPASI